MTDHRQHAYPTGWDGPNRPPEAERTGSDRTDPVRVSVRTHWLYTEPREDEITCACCPGRHSFAHGAVVTRSDVPFWADSPEFDTVDSHVHRAVAAFGDDADLVIEVRRAAPEEIV